MYIEILPSFVFRKHSSYPELVGDDQAAVHKLRTALVASFKAEKDGEDQANSNRDREYPVVPPPAKGCYFVGSSEV